MTRAERILAAADDYQRAWDEWQELNAEVREARAAWQRAGEPDDTHPLTRTLDDVCDRRTTARTRELDAERALADAARAKGDDHG